VEYGSDMNKEKVLHTIEPYKHKGQWVFDDAAVGLDKEPFVSGADDLITLLSNNIPNAERGFSLTFSDAPFPGCTEKFDWEREEGGGNWYSSSKLGKEGWLCPALFKYFTEAPKELFALFSPK
jgi:hypothetical protein